MPYSREHKTQSRERILNSALRMFSEGGFEQVTIDKVMTNAGLTPISPPRKICTPKPFTTE